MEKRINQGPFFHIVFFWLKKPQSNEDKIQLELELKNFIKKNKQLITSHVGKPAGTKRTVVDNTYDLSLILTFDSKEDQEIYQSDPFHLEFIDKASKLWDRVQVYDSLKV
tara:strand:+ start:967 stop:1296 length:330 start_codon:yes stop_codon:yes gene_type:complete